MSVLVKKKSNGVVTHTPCSRDISAKIKLLKNYFPNLEDTACEDILRSCSWSVEDAKSYLKNTTVKVRDDRTYTHSPSKELEWDVTQRPASGSASAPLLERSSSSNGAYKTYPPGASASASLITQRTSTPSPVGVRANTPPQTRVENKSPKKEDWERIFHQMNKDSRRKYVEDLQQELLNPDFERVLWKVIPLPEKVIPKTLVLLRGVPGSGKSTIGNLIINTCGTTGRKFSTDEYFINEFGNYVFISENLKEAHAYNQNRCALAMQANVTPIIIDNTNTQTWEMIPYVRLAIENSYFIEVLEPSTTWKKNAKVLAAKNTHGVPKKAIQMMLGRYEENISVDNLLREAGLKSAAKYDQYLQQLQRSGYAVNQPRPKPIKTRFDLFRTHSIENINPVQQEELLSASSPQIHPESLKLRDFGANLNGFPSVPQIDHGKSNGGKEQSSPELVANEFDLKGFNYNFKEFSPFGEDKLLKCNLYAVASSAPLVCETDYEDVPQETENNESVQIEPTAATLYNMFPETCPEFIDDIFSSCHGDLNLASEVLLDGQHNLKSRGFLDKLVAPPASSSSRPALSRSKSVSNGKKLKSAFVPTMSASSHSDEDLASTSKTKSRSTSSNGTSTPAVPQDFVNGDQTDEPDLFLPTDGEDWFDLQLDHAIVQQLTETFVGYKPHPGQINSENLKIRIPPSMAFELFRYYSLGCMEKAETLQEVEQEDKAASDPDPIVKDLVEMEELISTSPNFRRLVEIETRLSERNEQDMAAVRNKIPNSMATKLAIDELQNNFPKVARSDIETIYAMSGLSYEKSLQRLNTDYADKRRPEASTSRINSQENSFAFARNSVPQKTAEELREEARRHHVIRTYYGNELCTSGERLAKAHYADKFYFHTQMMDEANEAAAELILNKYHEIHGDDNDLDLHHLFVHEALKVLKEHLEERGRYMKGKGQRKLSIRVITGRGKNSFDGRSKLGPAVVNFLKNNHYSFRDCHGYIVVDLKRY